MAGVRGLIVKTRSSKSYHRQGRKGQGIVEYAGALIICVLLISIMIINKDVYADMFETILNSVTALISGLI
jgi:hypothetical protein